MVKKAKFDRIFKFSLKYRSVTKRLPNSESFLRITV